MFAAVLFGVAKNWKQPKCSPAEEYTRCWRMYTAEYAPQRRRTPARCMSDMTLRKKPEAKEHRVWFHLHKGQEQIRGFHDDSRTWAVLGGMDGKVLDGEWGGSWTQNCTHLSKLIKLQPWDLYISLYMNDTSAKKQRQTTMCTPDP